MQTLEELQDATKRESIDLEEEEEVFEDTEEEPQSQPVDQEASGTATTSQAQSKHQRTSSEVDYGIERAHPNGGTNSTAATKSEKDTTKSENPAPMSKVPPQPIPTPRSPPPPSAARTHLSPPAQTPRRPAQRKSSKASASSQRGLAAQARALYTALSNLARNMAITLQKNPTAMLRFLLFVLMFVVAASQKVIRERVRRVLGGAWEKVRGTVGMGVKVSYI